MIYLDNHATTPCDPQVVEAMLPYFLEQYGNASSPHYKGLEASKGVKEARLRIANLLGASEEEIIFTSGATESNNLAILGPAGQHRSLGGGCRRIITTTIEHKSVTEVCQSLTSHNWEIINIPVEKSGRVDLVALEAALTEETLLISIQAANSEIGTIQPIKAIAHLAHQKGILVHCDAAQAVGKINIDVNDWGVDLLSLSGHKIYGPKGIGALYIRGGSRKLPLKPLFFGGMQEGGLRPGTLPVPLIVGLGMACKIISEKIQDEIGHLKYLRDTLEKTLTTHIPTLQINAFLEDRLPNNSSLTFHGLDAEILLTNLPTLALSTGSACESGSIEPSKTLLSIGLSREAAYSTIRIGLGRFNTESEINEAAKMIGAAFRDLKSFF